MTRYIESKPNGDGSWDHDDVESAYSSGHIIYMFMLGSGKWEINNAPSFSRSYKYRAYSPDSYGIKRPSSTLSEIKGDGPAVAEMLLERIKELENILSSIEHSVNQALIPGNDWRRELRLIASTIEVNKEQK